MKKLLAFGVAGLLVLLAVSFAVAEPEFSVTGHFRVRSYWITNPDLVKGGPERSYSDQRLILNPVLKLSDWIQLKARIRALDYCWGYNTVPGLTWPEQIGWDRVMLANIGANQGESGTNNFQWDRAWVQVFLGKYGSVQIGRQQTDLFHNFSIAEEDTYPRYHYITPVFALPRDNNIMFGVLYDKRGEGNIDKVTEYSDVEIKTGTDFNGDGALTPYEFGDNFAWCPWVFFWNPKITVGYVFFVWDLAGAAENGKSANWIMHDAMINATIGPVEIKSEWDYIMGDGLPFGGPTDPGPFALRGSGDNLKHSFEFFVDIGAPIPSPVINRGSIVVGLFSGSKPKVAGEVTGSIGSNEDWVDEWKIDLICWDQIFNSIYNAWIIRPKIDFVVPNTKFGGFVSACMSFADQEARYQDVDGAYDPVPRYVGPGVDLIKGTADDIYVWDVAPNGAAVLTGGSEKSIGTEIDLGINYTLGPRQTIELVLGYFAPGKYFAETNRDSTVGAALKTHIRF